MKDLDQIKAIAELDGWLDVKEYTYKFDYMGEKGETEPQLQGRSLQNLGHLVGLPNYLTSRDVIVPVIEKQTPTVKYRFLGFLYGILNTDGSNEKKLKDDLKLIFATPTQLCESLLRATGKWKE